MEQTQLLEWDGEGDSTDGSDAAGETPKPVGRLHQLSSTYGPDKDFWIYPGENAIGRLEHCHVCLPASSVSKAHAVIEVPSSRGPHLLYDRGSLNRTRRQRVALIPQVRYSLQDGDTLVFGDVTCQYFILAPDSDCDSLEESMAVPPTQERVEASALAIEETPAPGRRIGFGQVLVQDSDKEEEGEEVINGTGSNLPHTARDESGCSNKNGVGEGQVSLASFGVSSPSSTVVPESDDESGDLSASGPPCPALRLSFESQDAERGPTENGDGHSSSRKDSGEPTAEEEGASTEHGLVEGFHLDSDTDVEDESQMGCVSEAPASLDPSKRDRDLEVDTEPDLNESSVMAPEIHCPQTSVELGSDTDAEETMESPAAFRLKLPSTSLEKEDDDTDMEAEMESPSVVGPGKHKPVSPKEDDCQQLEGNVQLGGEKDDDTNLEEASDNSESGVNALPPTAHEDVDTDVEGSSVKGEAPGRTKDHEVGGDSDGDDTEEEVINPWLENSEDTCPQRTCFSSAKKNSMDREEIHLKRIVPDDHRVGEGLSDVVGLTQNSNLGLEMSYEVGDKSPRDFDEKEPLPNPEHHNLPLLFLGSDTDGEEEAGHPDAESKENPQSSGVESSKGSRVSHLGDPDIGSQEKPTSVQDKDSDTDVEMMPVGHDKSTAQDSDTDTEDVAAPLLRKPLEEKGAQSIIPVKSEAGEEQLASSAVGVGVSLKSREDDEDTDAEGEESYSADESNTDDEIDVSLQATQCYLPTETTSPRPEKAGGITATDSDCALEEEPTQAFDFSSPFLPAKCQLRNVTSLPLKDNSSDQEDDMLEATQPYCQEPEPEALAELCEALAGKKKLDPERLVQNQPEGEKCFEQVPHPDFPASTSPGEETTPSLPGDNPLPQAMELPPPQSSSKTAGGASEEETQPLCSLQIPLVASQWSLTPQEEKRVEVPEGGSPSEVMLRQSEATPLDDQVEENSELVRETRNPKKVPAEKDPASTAPPARELRRSLRSSTASASPAPVLERRSLRQHGSGAVVASGKPAAPESRRRGLRQLSKASQRKREVKERPEQPGEEGPRKKARNGDLTATPVPQAQTRSSQRESRAASKVTEVAAAVSVSPGAREPTKRARRGLAPSPGLEGQPERPRTRASKLSSSSSISMSTPSPKDSGKSAKPGQEQILSTPSSGRKLRHHSPEDRATSEKASSGSRNQRSTGFASPAPKVWRVLFTGVIDEEGERVVAELGGSLAKSVFDCTHLVTDRVRRTVKFLCALARGIPIVTLDWLEKSRRNAFFLAPNSFLVRDPEQEKNLRFSLSTSLQKAQQKGALFQGYEIHVTPNVKPEPEYMKDIVKCSGGTLLPRMPRAFKEKRIVVSCPEDLSCCKPAQEAGVPVTNAEFILTGILQQTVDLQAHRLDVRVGLSPASSPLVPSTRTSKRRAATRTAPAPPSTAKRRR
ncbi:mediator of DNA damage checkpoint protein 1 isoform X1 [Crotalus tigris]|uniref:mediator of DNA damage checkpoint protein 1 isoform X1 n=1 Tax=Crotalus tigris TaxID=88082 RepID=UPI00192FAD47|nr:mediator of DNA damage checkpoint protein 1 isoform X1 [Crotalus tigris]XP_039213075.1 mediator of DNA damage checkpoint protein 1 isoform X1 [Crotalus tigris]